MEKSEVSKYNYNIQSQLYVFVFNIGLLKKKNKKYISSNALSN